LCLLDSQFYALKIFSKRRQLFYREIEIFGLLIKQEKANKRHNIAYPLGWIEIRSGFQENLIIP
jgi:hypothetical protein